MKEYLQQIIKKNGLRLSLLLIIAIVCANAVLVIYFRNVIIKSSESAVTIQKIRDGLSNIDSYFRQGDIGVRAYLIKQNSQFLLPYNTARDNFKSNLDELEVILIESGFDINLMTPARAAITDYMQTLKLMIDLSDKGRVDEAIDIFLTDPGLIVWQKYSPFIGYCNDFIDQLAATSNSNYKSSINLILVIQIFLIILAVPILSLAYRKIVKDDRFRMRLFKQIDESNKKYLFNDGEEVELNNEDSIITSLIANLKKAAAFINNITNGNYNIGWDGMAGKARELNRESIAGELIMMRDQMKNAKKEDDIRIWTNEGLSKFGDLIRKYQDDLTRLSDELISNIVVYLKAQQGGLFFLNDEDPHHRYLDLVGCYAYQRKKFLEKKIELGQGMVGQCFLEGETTYLTNVPEDYVNITSGLGETNPQVLLVVPLRLNDIVVGVIEIANLKPFEKYQIDFLERLAESIASAISSVKTNEKTKVLLEQSQQQAEEMRAQEEEMRQNMEELQATQEQMHRKNEEVESLLRKASENEESMKLQMETLAELELESSKLADAMKLEAENFKGMLMDVLNEMPEKVFLKDAEGKIFIANQKVADVHGLPLAELIGKSDYDFVDKETADEWRRQELEILKKGEEKYVFEDNIGGKTRILESFKKAFYIKPLDQQGLLGIQRDITEITELERVLEETKKSK
jgi:PAS domain S-box-containing protein